MKKNQFRVKIKYHERFQYRKNGYQIGSRWTERDKKGLIRYYCYAYKDKLKLKGII